MSLPYEDMLRWFEGEVRGQTGSAVGGAVGGYPGSVRGREIAMGLNVNPWMPKWTPPRLAVVNDAGEEVGTVGLWANDGTLVDPVTGEPMDAASVERAARLLLGDTIDGAGGMSKIFLDSVLGDMSGVGQAALGGAPDERLADATGLGTSDDPSWSMRFEFDDGRSRTDAAPARTAPTRSAPAPQPSLLEVLGRMYGDHMVPAPPEPPSIFDASVYGTGAPAGSVLVPSAGSAGVPAGSAGVPAGSPFVAPPPPGATSAPSGSVITAPRATGASGAGALYSPPAAPPRDPLRELWPPTPAGSLDELFDAVTPGRPQLPRGSPGAPRGGGDDPNDLGDLDRWAFDLGLLGALEAIPELLQATAKQMARNALYLTPVGIPLAVEDIGDLIEEVSEAADRNGGGVPGLLDALNERFNPLAGLVRNTVEAVEAAEDKDARKLGNRMFKLGIEVLGMVGMLRGGGKGAAAGGGRGRTTPTGQRGQKPTGPRTPVSAKDMANQESLIMENSAADILADHGYKVRQNPLGVTKKGPDGVKRPDYDIEDGQIFDHYGPKPDKPRSIATTLREKIEKKQARRFVLDMRRNNLSISQVIEQFTNYPIAQLEEIIVITKDGDVVPIWPPD
ncbi:hypothetical protein ACMHYB_55655 [Sorangium sp. So ce1128]